MQSYLLVVLLAVGASALSWPGDQVICSKMQYMTDVRSYTEKMPYNKQEQETVQKPCPLSKLKVTMYERVGRELPYECDKTKDPIFITQMVTKTYYRYAQKYESVRGDAYCDRGDMKCANGYVVSDDDAVCERPRPTTTEWTVPPTTTEKPKRGRKTTTDDGMGRESDKITSRYLTTPKKGTGRKWWWDIVG